MAERAASGRFEYVGLKPEPRPTDTPWHPFNRPRPWTDPEETWSERCEAWCKQKDGGDYSLRTHYPCPRCGFTFLYRTGYYSMGSDSDVTNYAVCADPDCGHTWEEYS